MTNLSFLNVNVSKLMFFLHLQILDIWGIGGKSYITTIQFKRQCVMLPCSTNLHILCIKRFIIDL